MALVVGLDVGTKTIGVARMDDRIGIGTPWFTLSRSGVKADIARLRSTWKRLEEPVTAVVVGLPLELDGTEGRSCRLARQVGDAVAAVGLAVHYQDERFSTVEAARRLTAAGHSARDQKAIIDQAAAAVILEDWHRRVRPAD